MSYLKVKFALSTNNSRFKKGSSILIRPEWALNVGFPQHSALTLMMKGLTRVKIIYGFHILFLQIKGSVKH